MKVTTRLDRMVAREVLAPAALGFVVYTFLLMMRAIFSLVEQIFVRGVSFADALRLLAYSLPHVVVLTIPMGYLFGVLITIGRMNTDNELIALQAVGVSARRLLRPVLGVALTLAMLNGFLMLCVMPAASRSLRELRVKVFSNARALGRIEPRVFHEGFPNLLLYVQEVDESTGDWRNVLLYDRGEPGVERLTLARRGRLLAGQGETATAPTPEPWIELEDAVTHQFMPSTPATYRVNQNKTQLHRVPLPDRSQTRYRPGVREQTTASLIGLLSLASRTEEESKEHLQAALELHRRVAIPSACLVFGLLALPLGVGSRSGGRGRGFVLSIAVILVYYVMLNHGELLATAGRVPVWLGIWLPNLLLSAVSLLLSQRMGRWLGERRSGGWVATGSRAVTEWWERRHSRGGRERRAEGTESPRSPRRRTFVLFPTLLDRYLTGRLLLPLVLVLLSTASLYVVVDLTDRIDEIAKNHIALGIVLAYYWNLIPQVVLDVTPFALMVAVLIVLTVLERQLELTALKAAGLSVFRVMVPVLALAALASSGLWILEESVVPNANREAKRLLDRIRGRDTTRSYRTTDRQWLMSRDGSTLYGFLNYDVASRTMTRLTLFRIDSSLRLRYHLFADRVHFENGVWLAESGWFRDLLPDGTDQYRQIMRPLPVEIPEGPDYFGQEYRLPAEMSYRDLGRYIQEVADSGYRPSRLLVCWHQKLSYPLSAFVMVFLALPYGLNRGGRRVTTMQGVALALGLGIAYSIAMAVFGKMGEANLLPPTIAAWGPVAFAAVFSLNRMTTLRT